MRENRENGTKKTFEKNDAKISKFGKEYTFTDSRISVNPKQNK